MVAAVGGLLQSGRVKLYCVDSFDAASWSNRSIPLEQRAQANFSLKRADVFPLAICLSGNYDPTAWDGWGERGEAAYFNNPTDYVAHLEGDHLAWLRGRVSVLLVCGQGQWEDTTGALESTRRFAGLLASKGIRCELDVWGYDTPHDWPSWRAQLAHHLPRFC
jgi:esterase/lipase superfamily enzyme